MKQLIVYFDFISPYAWLAIGEAPQRLARFDVQLEFRPVVFSKLLDAAGLVGPVESDAKRPNAILDVMRCAQALGRKIEAPPEHPFRSIEALRTVCLFQDDPLQPQLVRALTDTAWEQGKDLTDIDLLAAVVAAVGLDPTDLEQRIAQPEVKNRLFAFTAEAIEAGAFGVPSFLLDGELFWGHDRIDQIERRLEGEPPPNPEKLREILDRPVRLRRKKLGR